MENVKESRKAFGRRVIGPICDGKVAGNFEKLGVLERRSE